MRIGIFGDIHSNYQALTAVLDALGDAGVDRLVCTGDLVGYGANPKEVIDVIREREIPVVLGNHDQYTSDGEKEWRIRPEAQTVIRWNRDVLPASYLEWLSQLPRSLDFGDFSVVHSSHVPAPDWPYILDTKTAVENFVFQKRWLCFNGHTHVPLCVRHRSGKRPEPMILRSMFLPRCRHVMIGVGSVGQPRDGDPRAAAVIYDSIHQSVRLFRVPYDVRTAQERITRAGLPEALAERLELGE